MNAFHEYRRRHKYLLCLIDELHGQLSLAEPVEGARVRPARKMYLIKLFKYKRRGKGISLLRA
ncbi:hypothetical protein PPUJ20028_33150 [Pseudomonas putida]|uniref:Uncharacterized protein n=1 Tax=Pseudomonas putida TaxID=303 RepID=A0AA37RC06_PSEPU|nr:hypothetical protein [Pseudomonas putida]GLO14732.1 hypothetical protein PPUJ20028_33150 [Pseudomonas putida]GLO34901.1 hypothetical protein PPUN14671_17340 [Pseudomonas putida]HDS0963615.1 hypothetical protein [Pseudomonas putida]HDS0988875.1 hypothetical protein [Pseudomonas putida]